MAHSQNEKDSGWDPSRNRVVHGKEIRQVHKVGHGGQRTDLCDSHERAAGSKWGTDLSSLNTAVNWGQFRANTEWSALGEELWWEVLSSDFCALKGLQGHHLLPFPIIKMLRRQYTVVLKTHCSVYSYLKTHPTTMLFLSCVKSLCAMHLFVCLWVWAYCLCVPVIILAPLKARLTCTLYKVQSWAVSVGVGLGKWTGALHIWMSSVGACMCLLVCVCVFNWTHTHRSTAGKCAINIWWQHLSIANTVGVRNVIHTQINKHR